MANSINMMCPRTQKIAAAAAEAELARQFCSTQQPTLIPGKTGWANPFTLG
ncbi:hypothetical protein LAD67_16390 [Escherichia coli]|nr:hypothetical protein [Escherichia coli]